MFEVVSGWSDTFMYHSMITAVVLANGFIKSQNYNSFIVLRMVKIEALSNFELCNNAVMVTGFTAVRCVVRTYLLVASEPTFSTELYEV